MIRTLLDHLRLGRRIHDAAWQIVTAERFAGSGFASAFDLATGRQGDFEIVVRRKKA